MPEISNTLTQLGFSPEQALKIAGYLWVVSQTARLLRPMITRAITWAVDRFDDMAERGRSDGIALLIIVDSGLYRILFVLVDFFFRVHLPTRASLNARWDRMEAAEKRRAQAIESEVHPNEDGLGGPASHPEEVEGRRITGLPIVLLLLNLWGATLLLTGCVTRELDPQGVYRGDKILFTADDAITRAYDSFDAFVTWEHRHRAALATWPEIKQAADTVRLKAEGWIDSAIRLRETYKADPSEPNRAALASALSVLRQALTETAMHMARHSTTIPTTTPSAP